MKKIKLFMCVGFMSMLTAVSSGCTTIARVPVPKVKEARFNFSVTYLMDGEEKTYSDVYVCKYDGAYKTLVGDGIDWEGYVENGEENGVIPIQTNEDGIIYIDLYFVPEYFMGDPDAILFDVPAPALYMVYHSDDPEVSSYETDQEILARDYGVRLISYKYADPIENVFEEKWTFVDFVPTIN